MDRQSDGELMMDNDHLESKNKACLTDAVGCLQIYCLVGCSLLRECIKLLVNHRRFQQCILLAILINTLSMGIEYHNQVNEEQNDLPFRYYLFLSLFIIFIIFFVLIITRHYTAHASKCEILMLLSITFRGVLKKKTNVNNRHHNFEV